MRNHLSQTINHRFIILSKSAVCRKLLVV